MSLADVFSRKLSRRQPFRLGGVPQRPKTDYLDL